MPAVSWLQPIPVSVLADVRDASSFRSSEHALCARQHVAVEPDIRQILAAVERVLLQSPQALSKRVREGDCAQSCAVAEGAAAEALDSLADLRCSELPAAIRLWDAACLDGASGEDSLLEAAVSFVLQRH